ncbi:MAG: ABC transporter permease, partial [Chloroflexota bacterium]
MDTESSLHHSVLPHTADDVVISEPESQLWRGIRRFLANRVATASFAGLAILVVLAILAPLITRQSPTYFPILHMRLSEMPSARHWLGTDGLGRDQFSRVLYGLRPPVAVGFIGAILCSILGGFLGVTAGYFGGWVDVVVTRITELVWVVPGFLLVILVAALFGQAFDAWFGAVGILALVTILLATDSWPLITRLSRAESLRMRQSEFVEAAIVGGSTHRQIIRRHLLSNLWGILSVQGAFHVGSFIFTEAVLTFFGLGTPAPIPDVGQMSADALDVLY